MSCQRCGQPLSPNTPTCPRCGAPVTPSAGWSQPQPGGMSANPFAPGPAAPYAGPQSPSLAFGGQQPPRFSAGSLISDGDLPEWLREGADGRGAPQPPYAPQQPQQPPAWSAPAQPGPPARGGYAPGWPQAPEPPRPDIDAQHTVRQPAFGGVGQAAQQPAQNPYGPAQSRPQPPASYGQQGYPPQQPAWQAPQAPMPQPPYAPPQPAYPQAPSAYPPSAPMQPAYPQPYAPNPAYTQQPQQPQQPQPQAPINAFPSIEQAGAMRIGPQAGGMGGHALLNQQSLPSWLSGAPGQPGMGQIGQMGQIPPRAPVPSGMQARSLIDDQALPKWLRDQPESAARPNVSEWLGGSATQEPMPQFLSEAYAPAARAPQAANERQAYQAPGQGWGANGGMGGAGGYADETAMPDWMRAQAGGAYAGAAGGPLAPPPAPAEPHAGGFAASDLIDPTALPAWVTGRAPAAQVFSSTHGWSAANPEGDASAPGDGYSQGYDQSFDQGYDQGYDQGDGQGQAGWDDAQDDMAYPSARAADPQSGRGQPLSANELPPWLRGKAGAPAAGARAASPGRNPWASAAEPMESADGWDDAEPWDDEPIGQAGQNWGASGDWDDGRSASRNADRDEQMSGWGYDDPNASASAGWADEPAPRGGTARRGRVSPDEPHGRSRRDERAYAAGGYNDGPYDQGYDQGYDQDYGQGYDRGYDQGDDDYDEQPSERERGRGWLGFLRRDKR